MKNKNNKRTSRNWQKTNRWLHQWLMLLIGLQFVIWSISGAYMVFFDINYIHGNSLVKNQQAKVNPAAVQLSLQQLLLTYPQAKQLSLGMFIDKPVYRFKYHGKPFLVDATNGEELSPLGEHAAIEMARHEYTGTGDVVAARLITTEPPFELAARHLPVWQVSFADFGSPTLYVSVLSGQVVTKRHQWWRLFDWMFRFHVMDYQDSEVDNQLLFYISVLGLVGGLTGLLLTFLWVAKPLRRAR